MYQKAVDLLAVRTQLLLPATATDPALFQVSLRVTATLVQLTHVLRRVAQQEIYIHVAVYQAIPIG